MSTNGHGTIIRVAPSKSERRPIKQTSFETLDYEIHIAQATLESAYYTKHGLFLLQLLKACDYATRATSRGILLMGRKVAGGGFKVYIRVPINPAFNETPPSPVTNGVERTA